MMKKKGREMGFSLIEIVMVIVVLSIVGLVGSNILFQGAESYFEARDYREAVQEVRYAVERMTREIREDIDKPSSDITTMTATNLTYTDPNSASISFALNGTDLERNSVDLAKNVTSLAFTYLQKDDTTAATAANVWKIKIAVTVTVGNFAVAIRTIVFPRNAYNDITSYVEWKEA
jgi:prepilin-type N-terminal cleavage/methylation domain-containing protein